MSEDTPTKQTSREEIRLRERRAFDAFNEEQAKRRQVSRDRNAITSKDESDRWRKREVDTDNSGEKGEQASPGG